MAKVAIVTGAADGIGLQCALLLVKKGYRVYDISHRRGEAQGMRHLVADVADRVAVASAVKKVLVAEKRVDLLVCAAGISMASPAELTRERDRRRLFDVNYWGSVYAAEAVLRVMKRQKNGCIALVSSLSAALPMPYLAYYSASKAAQAAFARALAGEARPFGVRVFAALPPGVHTQLSYKRKKYKNLQGDSRAPGLARAVKAISTIEQRGQSPQRTAASIVAAAGARPASLLPTGLLGGAGYLLAKALPLRCIDKATAILFGGSKETCLLGKKEE